jgi:hypothetical protein
VKDPADLVFTGLRPPPRERSSTEPLGLARHVVSVRSKELETPGDEQVATQTNSSDSQDRLGRVRTAKRIANELVERVLGGGGARFACGAGHIAL